MFMTRYFLLTLLFLMCCSLAFAQTSLSGKATDTETGEELIGANVVLYKAGVYISGTSTDFDGNYKMDVDPGTYDVECSYVGFPTNKITGVVVKASQDNKLDIKLGGGDEGVTLDEVIVIEYKVPLIEADNTTSGGIQTAEEIRNLPTKDINALAAQTAGLAAADEGDDVTIRGSRDNATNVYIDGIRVFGNLLPQSEIDQLQVITGGIEARYGDVTGGIISITTKGPSNKFSGGLELETSEFLDNFGYNLASANLSGPIIKKKSGESILGFRFSGQYLYQKDDDPPAIPIYKLKDEVRDALIETPVVSVVEGDPVAAGTLLTEDDVETIPYRQNEENTRLDLTAKLDARLSKNIDISFTGSYNDERDKFTPGGGSTTGRNWLLFNTHNNPIEHDTRYRGIFRFRHRLGASDDILDEEGNPVRKDAIIRNASYTIQGGFERFNRLVQDSNFKDDYFSYGHAGVMNYNAVPVFDPIIDDSGFLVGWEHADDGEVFLNYEPSTFNTGIAAYNKGFYADAANEFDLPVTNGNISSLYFGAGQLHNNINWVYNLSRKREDDIITANFSSSFDLMPGGSDKGSHAIQFGVFFEQRINRLWQISPIELWTAADAYDNIHFNGVDRSKIIGESDEEFTWVEVDSLGITPVTGTVPIYGQLIKEDDGSFYQEVRTALGVSTDEYVFADALRPDQLSLDMFNAEELITYDLINYYGYDYLGNKLSGDATFEDFFTDTYTKNGRQHRSYTVAPNKPIYMSAYIQDKFKLKDVIFRLGLRVDRYDANTKVLKDKYSLYEIMSANDFFNLGNNNITASRPGTIGDDFKVYVNGEDSFEPQAYRDGDQWYNANGTAVNTGSAIFGDTAPIPFLNNQELNPNDDPIKQDDFNIEDSFEDYKPQINFMPRLAFSFPISDVANFFAHYDILSQRPPSNTIATPLNYYFWEEERDGTENSPFNNPNLRPEQTIDYEVGFQQKLTNSSALKIAAYYKEMRNMIQQVLLENVAILGEYQTYGNVDFGTVKGFTFQYDLRRTGNISFRANYTLQFADGTGSDVSSARGLTGRGNLKIINPFSFDERHRLVTSIDYRYGSGKKYNGPRLFGKNIFQSAGMNLQSTIVSGRPYSATVEPDVLSGDLINGAINGARKPWSFTVNLRVDKNFRLSKPDAKTPLNLNVYLRIQNLLNQKNVINVYPYTGSPDDDGYLASDVGIDAFSQAVFPESDRLLYEIRQANYNNYSRPRRIYLGALFEF